MHVHIMMFAVAVIPQVNVVSACRFAHPEVYPRRSYFGVGSHDGRT